MARKHGHEIRVGEVIDAYKLESVVATGTTSTTFRARDQRLDRAVTLKVLHGELFAGTPGARERAVGDATLAASLEHPNIVPVYGAGEVGGGLWVASRLADGDVLADVVLTPRLTVEKLERVAEAIDAANAAGAVHREIRPECIVLDRWGNPLVRDFGVTRLSGRTGMATRMELVDTLRYAAPELILGRPATPAADVYGLAATAVRCLTGAHPFPDGAASELVALRAQAPPPALSAAGVDTTALNAAIAAGMALDPADRCASAADFVVLLWYAIERLPEGLADAPEPFTVAAGAATQAPPPVVAAPPPPSPPAPVLPAAASAPPAPPPGATRVDLRREHEPEPEPERRAIPWGTIALAAATVLVLTAGAFGIGRVTAAQPPAPPRTGTFEIVPGDVWRPAAVGQAPLLQFADPVVLTLPPPARALATVGLVTRPGPPGNPLAGEPLDSFAREPAPTLVRAGRRTLVRYRGRLNEGGVVTVHVLPTNATRALAVACSERSAEPRCAALVATARLGAARAYAPQPPEGAVRRIVEAVRRLERSRVIGEIKLNPTKRQDGDAAQGASRLASDYGAAAAALKLEQGDPGTRAQVARVSDAVLAGSLAYEQLATAIEAEDVELYREARLAALSADRTIVAALRRLRRSGYSVREA